ncbi:MAG: hypothetical protein RLZZ546_2065 [Bacteroidota bacterium]|jgi:uncharacterized protein YdiU (UPF0061 family)
MLNFELNFDFINELPSDPRSDNEQRQVSQSCYSFIHPKKVLQPKLLSYSKSLINELKLQECDVLSEEFLNVFSGKSIYKGSTPYSMCYGGHQFGYWAGQLGDGRAINLFDAIIESKTYTFQLKGAGQTPYSRNADGLAVLRSSIREFLCSEAMYHLGIPTTRALSLISTGEEVWRDMMYDGNAAYEPGAIVCRVAPSFIRFGNFEIFAARGELDVLKQLTDFTIKYYFPHINENEQKENYLTFFKEVVRDTMDLVLDWQRVGFVHGVMNTDNLSILSLTIDYGPYGWLEDYDELWTPNTTDANGLRYAFGNQPNIALWNLYKLASALYPLIKETAPFEKILNEVKQSYPQKYIKMMSAKLGIENLPSSKNLLIYNLIENFKKSEIDYTIFFRNLIDVRAEDDSDQMYHKIKFAFYKEPLETVKEEWRMWFLQYQNALLQHATSYEDRAMLMKKTNPKYVLRNYMAQLAIDAATNGDNSLIEELQTVLTQPYEEQATYQHWYAKRPEWAKTKIGCSMLSCSS